MTDPNLERYISYQQGKRFIEYVIKTRYKGWWFEYVSSNINVTIEIVRSYPDIPWDFGLFSANPNVTWDIVQQNPDIPWDYTYLSSNPNITWDIVKNNPQVPWDFYCLTRNPNITWKIIQQFPDYPWRLSEFWKNPNATLDQVNQKVLDSASSDWKTIKASGRYERYYMDLSQKLPWKIILENKHLPWSYDHVSTNPSVTWEIITKVRRPWNYNLMAYNPNITWDIIKNNPRKPWNFRYLTRSGNITWEIIQQNPDKKWYLPDFSDNPNVTCDILENNNVEWGYRPLSYNKFTVQRRHIELECRRRWQAAHLIQRNYLKCYWDNKYRLAQQRLQRVYEVQ